MELRASTASRNMGLPGRSRPTRSRSTRWTRPATSGSTAAVSASLRPQAGQHGRVDVDRGDLVAGPSQGHRDSPRSCGEFQDRTAGPGRQGEVQVDVAGIVDQIHVIQPRQGGGGVGFATQVRHRVQRNALPRRPDRANARPGIIARPKGSSRPGRPAPRRRPQSGRSAGSGSEAQPKSPRPTPPRRRA